MYKVIICIFTYCVCIFSATNESSFTPISMSVPIYSIDLLTSLSGGSSFNLYSCDTDCDIDMIDDDALSALTQEIAIEVNDYRYVTITTCDSDNETFSAEFSGYVTLGATDYYSSSSNAWEERTANQTAEALAVSFSQCTYYYEFQSDYVVSDSMNSYLTFFMDNSNLGWGMLSLLDFSEGCIEKVIESGGSYDIFSACVHFPQIVPIVSNSTPTIEEYRLYITGNSADTVGASVYFMIDDSDEIVGGFTRRYYSSNSIDSESADFDSAIERVTTNSDSTYSFDTFSDTIDSYKLRFGSFERANHSSTYTAANGTSYSYTAVKQ